MTAATAKSTEKSAAAKEPAATKTMFVLDTTAGPDTTDMAGKTIPGARIHEMPVDGVIKTYKFERNTPLELPVAIAVKFLKTEAFKHTDKDGNIIAYSRPPKQPDELQAGEKLELAVNETVARYDELSNAALQQRVLEMPGGEKFADNPTRKGMVDFVVATKEAAKKRNVVSERSPDTFIPEPNYDEDMAA